MPLEFVNLPEEQINFLVEKYQIPPYAITPEVVNALYALYQYDNIASETLSNRLRAFQYISEEILSSQLSANNMRLLKEVCNSNLDENIQPESILEDAHALYKIHVSSVVNDTIKLLHHGSAVEKLGAAISFVGKALDGISTFWEELTKKHAIIRVIDTCVIKPMVISFFAYIMPELAVIKACEFVGRTMIEKAKTGEWKSSIVNVTATMEASIIKHFEYFLGLKYPSKLIDIIENINNLESTQEEILKEVCNADNSLSIIMQSIENPKTVAACLAGAMVVSKITGIRLKDSLEILQQILYYDKNKEPKINIEDLCKAADRSDNIPEDIMSVFGTEVGGHVPKTPKSLPDIVETIQNSTKIKDDTKQDLIQSVVAYAITNEIERKHPKDKSKDVSHVGREAKRRDSKSIELEQGVQGKAK